MRFLRAFLATSLLFGAACDLEPRATTDPTREAWAAAGPQYKERVAQLRNRMTVVGGRVASLTVPPGVQDPALTAQISELQAKLTELEPAIAAFEQAVSQTGSEIDAALTRRDKIGARRMVDLAAPRLDQAYLTATAPFEAIEQRLPEAEAGTSRYLAAVAAEEQRMVRAASEGGDIHFVVKWNATALDIADNGTKAAFDRLVKLGGACDALRLTVITNDAARSADLTKKLVDAGVPADHVTAGTPDKMQAGEQVKVTVTAPCLPTAPPTAAPTAQGAPPPPPPAGAAAQLGMPPPPVPVVERVPAGGH